MADRGQVVVTRPTVSMRSMVLAVSVIVAALGRGGCGETSMGPTPGPSVSPSPSYPPGVPNATAFENVAHVREMERIFGRNDVLAAISTVVGLDGRVTAGGRWTYWFGRIENGVARLHAWTVRDTGAVGFEPSLFDTVRLDYTEMGPYLKVDSPQAVRLGLDAGAQAYVDRSPQPYVGVVCRWQGGRPVWELHFENLAPTGPRCWLPVFVDARTGELLHIDMTCLERSQ